MEERNCYVYEDYRMDNWTCCYVGMGSKNEENGYNRFEIAERNDYHDRILNKYGIVRTIIRDNLTREEANSLEEARIYYYVFVLGYTIDIKGYRKGERKDSHLTNQTWGGDGVKGWKHREESKKKQSEVMKEYYTTLTEEEKKEKYGRTGEKNPMYGKHHSEETRKKISDIRVEKGLSKGEKNPMYGKNPYANKTKEELEKWKKKLSEATQGEKNPKAKKVRCIETGEVFNTLKQAGEWCGMKNVSNIASQIRGKRKSAGKHPITKEKLHWEYVIEEEEIEVNLDLNIFAYNINISI